jgi:mannosyltransferase OCH1-like enzyme
MKTIPFTVEPRSIACNNQNIPRIIHQTFKTTEVPDGLFNAVNTWINLNPDYQYEFYDDARMIDFIHNFDCSEFSFTNEQLRKAFHSIKPGAGKADIFRYCVLYVYGGVYTDVDSECLVPLKDIISENNDIVTIINSWSKVAYHHVLSQWNMMYVKRHPVIKHTLELVIKSVLTRVPVDAFDNTANVGLLERFTGPTVYNKIFFDAMKIKTDNVRSKNFSNISEKGLSINLFGLKSNVRFIHYAENHYKNPARARYCIPKYIRFKYSDYYTDLNKLGLKYWAEKNQEVF